MILQPRYISLLLILISLLFVSSSTVLASKYVPILPVKGTVVNVVVNGNEKSYYLLTKTNTLKINVDGPAKLEVLTRLSLPQKHSATEKYSVKITEGGDVVKLYSTSTEKSEATYKNINLVPGKSRKFTLEVPEGTHTYECFLENTNLDEAVLKFYVASDKKGSRKRGITLEPLSYDRVVTAVVKEKLITYYVSSKDRNVQLRVVGPTRLLITARLSYDAAMKGEHTYALSIKEGEKMVLKKSLSTTKSLGIIYQELKDVVPGKVDKIYLDIPGGEHTYKFILEETSAHSIALKFSIPKKDIDNEG